MKIRIGIDYCTPTAERRPTTLEDLNDDIFIYKYNDKKDLVELLNELCSGYIEKKIILNLDKIDEVTLDDYIEEGIDILSDPGDGSPNIIFIQYDDEIIYYGYNLDIDYRTATQEDIIDELSEDVIYMEEYLDEVNSLIKEIESKK